jgi:HlyD family secretion protein
MTANVTFVYAEKDDVLRLPNAALRFRPAPGLFAQPAPGGAGRGGGASRPAGQTTPRPAGAESRDRRTVWIVRDSVPTAVRIRTGISDGSVTEIAEGEVQAGDVVITDAVGPPSGFAAGLRRGL